MDYGDKGYHERKSHILEALNYDIEVPSPLQWALVWFSAPTNLNAFDGAHMPRACFVQVVTSCGTLRTGMGSRKKKCKQW